MKLYEGTNKVQLTNFGGGAESTNFTEGGGQSTPPFYGGLGGRRKLPELRGGRSTPSLGHLVGGGKRSLPPVARVTRSMYIHMYLYI